MDSELQNQNLIINNINEKKPENSNEDKNIIIKSEEKIKQNDYKKFTNRQEENYELYIAKRSYSCRINEPKNRKFSKNDDICLNLNKKFMYLKTPQIKPQKGQIIIAPLNIGSISSSKKKPRFNLLNNDNDEIKEIISEGENEESSISYDSSSMSEEEEEIKDNNEDENFENYKFEENEKNLNVDELKLQKLKSENTKFSKEENKINEEGDDDYNEKGEISLKNLRRGMIQSKKIFLKNENDIFNKIDNNLIEKLKKYKADILMSNENEKIGFQLHKTVGFGQNHRKNCLPILEFLRKNSSKGLEVKNK